MFRAYVLEVVTCTVSLQYMYIIMQLNLFSSNRYPIPLISKIPKPKPVCMPRSPQLAEGYVSQIQLYLKPIQTATEALNWTINTGTKKEKTLLPVATNHDKAVENYTNALKPIKALFVAWLNRSIVYGLSLGCGTLWSEVEPEAKKPATKKPKKWLAVAASDMGHSSFCSEAVCELSHASRYVYFTSLVMWPPPVTWCCTYS